MKAKTRIKNRSQKDNQPDSFVIAGIAPFNNFTEKQSLISQIKKEFQNKVQISVHDNMLHYTHYYKENRNTVMI